jgi:hypothetical protein
MGRTVDELEGFFEGAEGFAEAGGIGGHECLDGGSSVLGGG